MRKALVVGIDDYPVSPLHGCVNDANAIANVIERNSDGSPNFAVKLITSPGNSISRASLRRDIEDLFSGDCDVALFYFSGHGFVKSTGGYIVTPDFKKYDEGISMDEILTLANGSKVKDRIVLLDCCFAGALGTPAITGNLTQLSEGLTVLTSSKANETSKEVDGGGIFTALVVDALNGGSADLRGNVTPGSIYAYVDQALGAWDQRPVFKTNVSRFTSLRNVTPPIAISVLRKLCEYFPKPQDQFMLNPTFEFTESKAIKENVAAFKDLQKYESVGLVVPVGEEHMYFAAMNSKACKLTAMGYQYWKLVYEKKI